MKVVGILVIVLNVVSALTLQIAPYKIYQVANESTWSTQTRIYGGEAAEEGRFPFMIFALMYTPLGIGRCSASLINPDWVLLAAHCVQHQGLSPKNIILVGGKANLLEYMRVRIKTHLLLPVDENALGIQERRAQEVFIHPNYNTETLHHDIALVKLSQQFNLNGITTIPLSNEKMKTRKFCTILGWGITPEDGSNFQLNYVQNKEVYTTEIGCKYKGTGPFICLKPRETGLCSGDSGGPLVCDGKVWGVASHLVFTNSDACGDSLEEYYSEIHPDLDWIKKYSAGNLSAVVSLKTMFVLSIFWLYLRNSLTIYKI